MRLFPSIDWQDVQNRMADDDQEALRQLYDHYNRRLFELAYVIVRSKEMAEEVVGDVFIQVWQKRKRMRTVENFAFYLYVMTRNSSRSYLRKYGHKRFLSLDDPALPLYHLDATPEDLMITGETLQGIHRAINELPAQCRLIFKLIKEDGLKYKEVAELLHLSIKTVENQMGIALKKIHAILAIYRPPLDGPEGRRPKGGHSSE